MSDSKIVQALYKSYLIQRELSVDEFGDKPCYCGHTTNCSCSNPDVTLFCESIKNKTILLNVKDNGWRSI
jgi:hypothetical protein